MPQGGLTNRLILARLSEAPAVFFDAARAVCVLPGMVGPSLQVVDSGGSNLVSLDSSSGPYLAYGGRIHAGRRMK